MARQLLRTFINKWVVPLKVVVNKAVTSQSHSLFGSQSLLEHSFRFIQLQPVSLYTFLIPYFNSSQIYSP